MPLHQQIVKDIERFMPLDYIADPMTYFEEQGDMIRTGEITYRSHGLIKRDQASVRGFEGSDARPRVSMRRTFVALELRQKLLWSNFQLISPTQVSIVPGITRT